MLHQAHSSDLLVQRNPAEVAYTMSGSVREALERIGRTEDAQFAPSGRRLALAGFGRRRILVLELTLDMTAAATHVTFDRFLEVESDVLSMPHGLCWLDDETLIVANRCGEVTIFAVPAGTAQTSIRVEPLRTLGAEAFISSPGSVSAATIAPGIVELLVCNNYVHTISRHLLDRNAGFEPFASEILLKRGLEVPDGVAQSASGRWIAVSNHNKHAVYLYRNDGTVDRASKPDGILRGILYPHGLRFSPDETSLVVADAGRPYVHVFKRSDGDWSGEHSPCERIQAISDEVFERGHYSREEGGPKGIDLTQDGSLLVASCDEQPLAIFDVRAILGATGAPVAELEAVRTREAVRRFAAAPAAPFGHAARLATSDAAERARHLFVWVVWKVTTPMWAALAKLRKTPGG